MKGPQFLRFCQPVIEVVREMGGSGRSRDVQDMVIERTKISEAEQQETNKNNVNRVRNQVAWARQYLVWGGILDSSQRGVWALSDFGKRFEPTDEKIFQLFKECQAKHQKKKIASPETGDETNDQSEDLAEAAAYQTEFINYLKTIPPYAFEKFCRQLLLAAGFEQVHVTSRGNDQGLDGHAIFNLNAFVLYKVIFQCKRYKDTVGPDAVRDFRGTLVGRAARGLIISTGVFTSGAKAEANREGTEPIQLVDGDELVDLCAEHHLGLVPRPDFEVDFKFFDQFGS